MLMSGYAELPRHREADARGIRFLAKPFALVDMYAMPNLIAGRRIVPELIQGGCTPTRVAEEAVRYFPQPGLRQTVSADLAGVRARLGEPGASLRAADAVLEIARRRPLA